MADELYPAVPDAQTDMTVPDSSDGDKRWNRMEVNRCLLPVLRLVDGEQNDTLSDEERDDRADAAYEAYRADPEAYRQLSHVFHQGSEELVSKWFGWIQCNPSLLDAAFRFIDDVIADSEEAEQEETTPKQKNRATYEKELYFISLFHTTDAGEAVDLTYPFEQYYFCDEVIYKDYLLRRLDLGDKCKAWIRHYLPYYSRIRAWYRENDGENAGFSREYTAYMELLEYFLARISYEDRLRDGKQELEYELGGLGWFNRRRKKEINRELEEIALEELKMRLDDTVERYQAYEAQFTSEREAWRLELEHAPWTAFGRKKELKTKLAALEEDLRRYHDSLGIDVLSEEYRKRCRKK